MLIAGTIDSECRLNRASQQWMIGQDPQGKGGSCRGAVTSQEHSAHERSVCVCGKSGAEPELWVSERGREREEGRETGRVSAGDSAHE